MDRAGLLASRVRMRSSGFVHGLPGNFPVAEGNVLAYSCAAARDLHPLPCLRVSPTLSQKSEEDRAVAKTRVPKNDKEPKRRIECTGTQPGKSNSRPAAAFFEL